MNSAELITMINYRLKKKYYIDPKHTIEVSKIFFSEPNVENNLEWLAYSPDLNPLEHI